LAAAAGVYVHGKAGDYLSRKYGDRGIIASDMLEVIPAMLSPEDTHSEILRAVGSELE